MTIVRDGLMVALTVLIRCRFRKLPTVPRLNAAGGLAGILAADLLIAESTAVVSYRSF